MDISVVIVTRNRARYVAGALLALSQQDAHTDSFEVIVGDNGSTDSTPTVCESYGKVFGRFRYFHDARPGQLVGWHTALAMAEGQVICFIDDDTRPSRTWIDGVRAAFADPGVGLVTGPIAPEFEAERPDWRRDTILRHKYGVWSAQWGLLDFGREVREIESAFVWGRNFIVRRDAMIAAGGFHPGGMPRALMHFAGDGDMAAGKRVESMGLKVLYHPACAVINVFQAHQDGEEEIHRWIWGEGLVTSYLALRRLHARYPDMPTGELIHHMNEVVDEATIKRIGRGYFTKIERLPAGVQEILDRAGREGFTHHQAMFATDPLFRDWVLRPNYLDVDACYTHPDLNAAA